MRHLLRLTACTAAALVALAPSIASAQLRVNVQDDFGERDSPVTLTLMQQPISKRECENNTAIPIEVNGANVPDLSTRFIAVWRGSSTSAACAMGTNRRTVEGQQPPCERVHDESITEAMKVLQVPARNILGDCTMTREFVYWFLLVGDPGDTTTDVAMTDFATMSIGIDPEGPAAASNLSARPGDANIPLTWTEPDDSTIAGARAYVDPMGCSESGMVESAVLMPNRTAPSSISAIAISGDDGSGSMNASSLPYNAFVAVGITLVDTSGNESVLSNVICVQRVQFEGALHDYCRRKGFTDADGGADIDACLDEYSCAIAGAGAAGRARLVLFAMLAVALGVIARRSVKR